MPFFIIKKHEKTTSNRLLSYSTCILHFLVSCFSAPHCPTRQSAHTRISALFIRFALYSYIFHWSTHIFSLRERMYFMKKKEYSMRKRRKGKIQKKLNSGGVLVRNLSGLVHASHAIPKNVDTSLSFFRHKTGEKIYFQIISTCYILAAYFFATCKYVENIFFHKKWDPYFQRFWFFWWGMVLKYMLLKCLVDFLHFFLDKIYNSF